MIGRQSFLTLDVAGFECPLCCDHYIVKMQPVLTCTRHNKFRAWPGRMQINSGTGLLAGVISLRVNSVLMECSVDGQIAFCTSAMLPTR